MMMTRSIALFYPIIKTSILSKTFRYNSNGKHLIRYVSSSSSSSSSSHMNDIHNNNDNNHNHNNNKVKKGNQIALSFYQFININDPDIIVEKLKKSLNELDIKGTLLVANEGYNGQFIVPLNDLDNFHSTIASTDPLIFTKLDFNLGLIHNFDDDDDNNNNNNNNNHDNNKKKVPFPFKKLIIRKKNNILTDGLPLNKKMKIMENGLDNGQELDANVWHEEISKLEQYDSNDDNKPLLLDCRNTYESEMGTFSGSQPLPTNVFSESWEVLDKILEKQPKDKRILTFCTGGIRCEKVNAYIKKQGYDNVGRLKHGIIGYERWINNNQSKNITNKFEGENFLFDRRRLENENNTNK